MRQRRRAAHAGATVSPVNRPRADFQRNRNAILVKAFDARAAILGRALFECRPVDSPILTDRPGRFRDGDVTGGCVTNSGLWRRPGTRRAGPPSAGSSNRLHRDQVQVTPTASGSSVPVRPASTHMRNGMGYVPVTARSAHSPGLQRLAHRNLGIAYGRDRPRLRDAGTAVQPHRSSATSSIRRCRSSIATRPSSRSSLAATRSTSSRPRSAPAPEDPIRTATSTHRSGRSAPTTRRCSTGIRTRAGSPRIVVLNVPNMPRAAVSWPGRRCAQRQAGAAALPVA
mgnify:CR=1 FL=1